MTKMSLSHQWKFGLYSLKKKKKANMESLYQSGLWEDPQTQYIQNQP